jgi:hypothetical protein
MLFIQAQIGEAGAEFAEANDALHLFAPMGGFQNAQAFSHNPRGAPA